MNLFQKPLLSKDEMLHTRVSVYIRYSSLVLERKESHPLHEVLNLKWRETAYFVKEHLAPNVQNTKPGFPLL